MKLFDPLNCLKCVKSSVRISQIVCTNLEIPETLENIEKPLEKPLNSIKISEEHQYKKKYLKLYPAYIDSLNEYSNLLEEKTILEKEISLIEGQPRMLKSLLENKYDVFAFKKYYSSSNTDGFLRNLELNHGIIVKDHSKTFCKLMLVDSHSNIENQTKSDDSCFRGNKVLDVIIDINPSNLETLIPP